MNEPISLENLEIKTKGMTELDIWAEKHGAKYEIISTIAYLIGVERRTFEDDGQAPKLYIYDVLDKEKSARIIRNLCILRTKMFRNNAAIYNGIVHENKTITGLGEFIPEDVMQKLDADGVDVYKHTKIKSPNEFTIYLNTKIKERLGNCRKLFPKWLNWDYLTDALSMPRGTTEEGVKEAAEFFYANKGRGGVLPYGTYINVPAGVQGNILFNDGKFVSLLYEWHGDKFKDLNLVQDIGNDAKNQLYDFIESSDRCVVVVDCENSDPYNLCAAFKGLNEDRIEKIHNVILYDDDNASSGWKLLSDYLSIPIERIRIERLKEDKSLTDIKVTERICREVYKDGADAVILVSSDSDYWGVISSVPEARFLVLVEHAKLSPKLTEKLRANDIYYCHIDDFYAEGGKEIREEALTTALRDDLKCKLNLDPFEVLKRALVKTRIPMSEDEISQYIKDTLFPGLSLSFEDGKITLNYNTKSLK